MEGKPQPLGTPVTPLETSTKAPGQPRPAGRTSVQQEQAWRESDLHIIGRREVDVPVKPFWAHGSLRRG